MSDLNNENSVNQQDQPQYQQYTPPAYTYAQPAYQPAPPIPMTATDSVFAWIALIAGYLFCCAARAVNHPLGAALFVIFLFCATAVVLIRRGCKFSAMPLTAAATAIALAASMILTENDTVQFFAYYYALFAYAYFVYAANGNSLEKGFSELLPADVFKAAFVMPFYSFADVFRGAFKSGKLGKTLLRILVGALITVVPTAIVLTLLSYDSGFENLMASIFRIDAATVFRHIVNIAFGIPIGMYIFGMYFSSVHKKCASTITADGCRRTSEKAKVAPAATVIAATVPLFIIYTVFFISQWPYYAAGFSGNLPDGLTYAQFAREGFFQLCAVSAINFAAVALVGLLTKKNGEAGSPVKRIVSALLSVCSLVLLSTAAAKMAMYVGAYGLTHLRVYASWFMAMLAVVFLLVIAKQMFTKFKLISTAIVVCIAMFIGLAFLNVDGLIAEYNVDRYLAGDLQTVDISELDSLGSAAVPQMIRLKNELDETDEKEQGYIRSLDSALRRKTADMGSGIFSFTVPRAKAYKALKEAGYIKEESK